MKKKMYLLMAAVAVSLVVAELGLRWLDIGDYWLLSRKESVVRGWAPYENIQSIQDLEGYGHITTNSLGYRDDEPPERTTGQIRIALLGDSFTAAVQVDKAQTWWSLVERLLNENCGGGTWDFQLQNFGVSGYSTLQELLTLETDVEKFAPELVLLLFFSGNDVTENYRHLADGLPRPFVENSKNRWHVVPPDVSTPAWVVEIKGWLYRFRLSQLVYKIWRRAKLFLWGHSNRPEQFIEPGINTAIYKVPNDDAWKTAWSITESLIEKIDSVSRSIGARFVLISASNGYQVAPDADFSRQISSQLNIPDLFYPERRLANMAERDNFPYIPLAPTMKKLAIEHNVFFHGFKNTAPGIGHWNVLGHKAAAHVMAPPLCRYIRHVKLH